MATPTVAKKPKKTMPLSERIVQSLRARALGKKHYARADALVDSICKDLPVGEEVEIGGGKKAVLVDQFATKTTVFRPVGIRRFEIKVTDAV